MTTTEKLDIVNRDRKAQDYLDRKKKHRREIMVSNILFGAGYLFLLYGIVWIFG